VRYEDLTLVLLKISLLGCDSVSLGAQFPAFLLVLTDPEGAGTKVLRKVRNRSPNDTPAHARTPEPSVSATAAPYQTSNNNKEYLIPTDCQLLHGYDRKKSFETFLRNGN
jgi:hypothetical protein